MSTPSTLLRAFAAAAAVAAVVAVPAAARSTAAIEADVFAYPGHATGPVEWKAWAVTLQGDGALERVSLRIPAGIARFGALDAVPPDTEVGSSAIATRSGDSYQSSSQALAAGPCANERGALATLHFHPTAQACVTVMLTSAPDGTVAMDAAVAHLPGAVALVLQLDNRDTGAGPLFPPNPATPFVADTRLTASVSGADSHDVVREVVGGDTRVTLSSAQRAVVYGRAATFTGRVTRGGAPSAGENVIVYPAAGGSSQVAETDSGGSFRISLPARFTTRWIAAAWKPASAVEPRLNTLAGLLARDVVVRAPSPPVARRGVRRLPRGRASALVVVRNPIAARERLTCRVYVAGRRVASRSFPAGGTLTFRVAGRRGSPVRAAVGRWDSSPIAPGWSRTIRL